MKAAGLILVVLGIFALIYQGITWMVPRDVVDLGLLRVTVYEDRTIQLPFVLGAGALVVGMILFLVGTRGGQGSRG